MSLKHRLGGRTLLIREHKTGRYIQADELENLCATKMVVYRMYDRCNRLLYVGKTINLRRRIEGQSADGYNPSGSDHVRKYWWKWVSYMRIELFDTEQEACMAEKLAIQHDDPSMNKSRWDGHKWRNTGRRNHFKRGV